MNPITKINYPDYFLDRSILVNQQHEYKINSFKLAKESEYFKEKIKEAFENELKNKEEEERKANAKLQRNKRVRSKSISEIQKNVISISYDDIQGLSLLLNYCHRGNDYISDINETNFSNAINAAYKFATPNFIQHCLDYLKDSINSLNCLEFWEIGLSWQPQHTSIVQISEEYIFRNFHEVSQTENFLKLPFHKLDILLKNDRLNIKEEKYLLKVLLNWISFDKTERIQFCIRFLKCIRLGQIPLEDLEEFVQDNLIKEMKDECQKIVDLSKLSVEEYMRITDTKIQNSDVVQSLEYFHSARLPAHVIYVLGGWEGGRSLDHFGPTRAVQIFNPKTQKWIKMLNSNITLDKGHAYSASVSCANKIYLIGGYVLSIGPVQTFRVFDFEHEQWSYLSPMHEKRNYVCACLLDNAIYAIGGHNGQTRLRNVERYDFKEGKWSIIPPMNSIRSDAGCAAMLGKVYVCGGFNGAVFHSTVEAFDPITNQWTQITSMNNIRSGVEVVSFRNQLYALGGNDGNQRLSSVERYDSISERWTLVNSMIQSRSNFCSCVMESEIYVIGGWSDEMSSTLSLVEKWNPITNGTWQVVKEMENGASANCCCVIDDINKFINHLREI